MPAVWYEFRCLACGQTETGGVEQAIRVLERTGLARRHRPPETDLIPELLKAAAPRLACEACQAVGFSITAAAELPDEEWQPAVLCQQCRQPIPAERIEALPDTTLCVRCQSADETNTAPSEPEYCPKCGNLLVWRQSRGSGITRYQLLCSTYPKCRGGG